MNYIRMMFNKTATVALPTTDNDLKKNFWLSALGIRLDDAVVVAKNLGVNVGDINWRSRGEFEKIKSYHKIADSHAECRVLKKMDGGILFVARVGKAEFFDSGKYDYKMARPCDVCASRISAKRISKVYYTINQKEYGIWDVNKDTDIIKAF